MKTGAIIMTIILAVLVVLGGTMKYKAYDSAKNPPQITFNKGKFALCPDKPNCENSQEGTIPPIKTKLEPDIVLAKITTMPGAKLEKRMGHYAHISFTTNIMGFVDDVEILYDKGTVHIKSASRVGYSDLGANKKRVEEIRNKLK
jgi:uncharacterized protein (DUF1499 family)